MNAGGKIRNMFRVIALLVLSLEMIAECGAATKTEEQQSDGNAEGSDVLLPEQVKMGFSNMVDDWDTFQNMFASKATIKWCVEDSDVCRKGTFDSHFGKFRDAVSAMFVEDTSLTSAATAYASSWLQHFTNYVETPTGCGATWQGYATYDFDGKGKIERMVIYSEKSMELLTCIAQYHEEMKNKKKKGRKRN